MAAGKYNYKKLTNDLRGGDLDIAIFGLRTIIKLDKGQLDCEETAIQVLSNEIAQLLPQWPEEVAFYGKRALEHLQTLVRLEEPDEEDPDDDAPVDIEALHSDDKRVVLNTLKRVQSKQCTEARDTILSILHSTHDGKMLAAFISALADIGMKEDLFTVRKYLKHTNDTVRAACVRAISGISDDEHVVEGMVEPFLQDTGGLPRAEAVRVIGRSNFKKVEEAVSRALEEGSVSDRAAMAEAVCSLDIDSNVPFIRRFAEDSEETVRMKVLETLEKGEHGQKPFILKMMVKDSSPVVAKVAKEALRRYETQRMLSIGGFKSMLPEDLPARKRMKDIEELQGQEELDPIELSDLKDPDERLQLLCLQKIRQKSYEKGYESVIDLLGVAEAPEILAAGINCLNVIGSHDDIALLQHFISHPAPEVRAMAARAVNQLARKEEAAFLLLAAAFDSEPSVRVEAVKAILRLNAKELLGLMTKMAGYRSLSVRMRLLSFLGHFSGDLVLKVFGSFLKSPEPKLRFHVLQCLFEQKDSRAVQLISLLAEDPVKDIAVKARQLLSVKSRDGFVESQKELPPIQNIGQVLQALSVQSEKLAQEQKQAKAEAEKLAEEKAGKDMPGNIVGKISADITSRKELDMLKLNRNVILKDMGKKVYRLLMRKEISHTAYDKTVFLIKKYKHLEEKGPAKIQEKKGFWDRIQEAAGIEKENSEMKKIRQRLEEQYIELGRTAFHLSYTENEIYQDLHMEYIELEAVENRISEKKEELGISE